MRSIYRQEFLHPYKIVKRFGILSFLTTLLATSGAYGAGFSVFGPTDFERQNGAPVTEILNFNVAQPTTYTITVFNGGLEDDQFELVSSSVITLNGVEIFTPSEFNQQVSTITKTVQLLPSNVLTVELRGKPGGGITINIGGEDDLPPTITAALSTPPNTNGWHNSDVTITYTCSDDFSGVVACPSPVIVSAEGANQQFTGTVQDVAGNTAQVETVVSLDKTAPTINSLLSTLPNAAGWHNADVVASFTCFDALSSVAGCPAPVNFQTEGIGSSTVSVEDLAGNTASTTVTVNLDKTAPILTSSLSAPANAAGWHNADVTVSYSCSDSLSGVAACVAAQLVQSEGISQPVTASVADLAGNVATVTDTISLDKTAPTIAPSYTSAANVNGWHNEDVTVSFLCADNLSSVASCSESELVAVEGADQAINGEATDLAGNTAIVALSVSLDKTPPILASTLSIPANPNGWHMADVTVSYQCSDGLSGIDSCPLDNIVQTEGAAQQIIASVSDLAGNTAQVTDTVSLDKTAPEIAANPSFPANAAGWHNADVTVNFVCSDSVDASLVCPAPVLLVTEGADQLIEGTVEDLAGNQAAASLLISLDKTAPVLSVPESLLVVGDNPQAIAIGNATATDNLSTPIISNDAPALFPFGTTSVSWTAIDLADNSATATQDVALTSAPIITSSPVLEASVGIPYVYNVIATDPNGDSLEYSLVQAPDGMEIGPLTGEITWIPQADQNAPQSITVLVTDSFGVSAEQAYTITTTSGERPFSHEGSEFWIAPTQNVNQTASEMHIYLVSHDGNAQATVDLPRAQVSYNLALPEGELVSQVIDEPTFNQQLGPGFGVIADGAIHITADRNITVYAVVVKEFTTDGYLALPVNALGTDYLMASYTNPLLYTIGTRMSVVAIEDNTQVSVTGTMDLFANSQIPIQDAGEEFVFTLNRGEVYRFASFNSYLGDYTGSRIVSDKPIVAYGTNHCSQVPRLTDACDHLVEQMPPVSSLGDEYFVAPLGDRVGYTIRVVAAVDDTHVSLNGAYVDTLAAGRFYELTVEQNDAFHVETSEPALVMQYANGDQFDAGLRPPEAIGGDPFMSFVPPSAQFLKRYQLGSPTIGFGRHFLNVIAPSAAIATMQLNGAAVAPSEFTQIANTDFHYASLNVPGGSHRLESEVAFGALAYGWDTFDSYGFTGGMAISPTGTAASLTLSNEGVAAVGELACTTANVANSSGAGVWGARVRFAVSGARAISDYEFTDSSGNAVFCYQGLATGLETIAAEFESFSDSLVL